MISKYPFKITVYRLPGTAKPLVQQHSYESLGSAQAAQIGHFADRSVSKVEVDVTLDVMTRADYTNGRRGPLTGG